MTRWRRLDNRIEPYRHRFDSWLDQVHRPFEVLIAWLSIRLAVVLLIAPPGRVEATLPPWLVFAWAVLLLVAAPLLIVGLLSRRTWVEALALRLLGSTATAYGAAILLIAPHGWSATDAGVVYLLLAAACAVRLWEQRRGRRILARAVALVPPPSA